MPFRLSTYTAPVFEPVHLNQAKIWLRLAVTNTAAAAYTNEDELLTSIVKAARVVAETETWRALVLQVMDFYLDEWPEGDEIQLPSPPLRAVESITYTESDGTVSTFSSADYSVDTDSAPGRVVLGYGETWPSATLAPKNPIKIRFRCGYAAPFSASASTDFITCVNHSFIDGDKTRLSFSGGALPAGLSTDTDYYIRDMSGNTFKLAATAGGAAIDITDAGSGLLFCGEIPREVIAGLLLVVTDLYSERGDTVTSRVSSNFISTIPRSASILFGMNSVRDIA